METPDVGRGLDVVIVYAFDCTTTTPAWNKMDEVYWTMHHKLTRLTTGSCLGYVYVMSTPNTYTRNMELVDSEESAETGDKRSPLWRRTACEKNMASGLVEACRLIRDHGKNLNGGVILFFSDGSINKGDYFDGTETFSCAFPVHTFTLAGDTYNKVLRMVADNSPRGSFNPLPVPDNPKESGFVLMLLDNIISNTIENKKYASRAKVPQTVVIVYAFDSTTSTPAYKKVDEIFWMVHRKLTDCVDNCLGYIYVMSTPNTYTSDMKLVDPTDKDGSYKCSPVRRRTACTKNMASGLFLANKLIKDQGRSDGIILVFSDGLINKGDFFDGVEGFTEEFMVYRFTVGGGADKKVPDNPKESARFSEELYSILPPAVPRPQYELSMSNLFLYRTHAEYAGPNAKESSLVNADGIVTNGEIYEGVGPNATLVARALGPNFSTPHRFIFRIMFEIGRLKGSSLLVHALNGFQRHWDIVGGTGHFSMAFGDIGPRFQEKSDGTGTAIRLSISVNCPLWDLPPI